MKKYYYLFFLLLSFSPFALNAVPILNEQESSKYLDYGKGHRYQFVVTDLTINTEYIVMVANNTNDRYNITFVASQTIAEIHIDYTGIKQTIYGDNLNQLQIIFVEDSTIHFTWYIPLKYNDLASLLDWLLELLVFAFQIFLGGIIVIFIAKKF